MIREFVRGDTEEVIVMAQELQAESPVHQALPFDAAHVSRIINAFTVRGWVSETKGTLRGYCFATVVPSLVGPARIGTDLSIYVRKPYRNGLIAARFLQAMQDWGRIVGVHQWQHVISTGNPAIERMYERLGFERTGSAFVKNV